MKLQILRADKTLYRGEAEKIIVPAFKGEMTILKDHIPLITDLKKGIIRVFDSKGQKREFKVERGIINIRENRISILVDESAESI
jgi:ATP synthase F1 epsilon subunit